MVGGRGIGETGVGTTVGVEIFVEAEGPARSASGALESAMVANRYSDSKEIKVSASLREDGDLESRGRDAR